MKKIFAILFVMIVIATMFIGCKKEEESEPVNGTTEPVSAETVEDVIDNLTEDVSVEETKKDNDGNEIIVGKDDNGNTVEVKTDKDGKVTKTITDKNTGKKTEQTTVATTTNSAKKTTNKNAVTKTDKTVTTTKKSPNKTTTTTKPSKKPAQQTTTAKPINTTTTHKHDYKPIYKTQKVLIQEAYDEPIYETRQAVYCSGCGIEEVTESRKYGITDYQIFHMKHIHPDVNDKLCPDINVPLCPGANDAPCGMAGDYFGKPNWIKIQTGTKHHDAVYENRKVVDYYKCSCGATKK